MSALAVPDKKMSVKEAISWSEMQAEGSVYELVDGYLQPKYGSWVKGRWEAMAGDKQGHNSAKVETGFALRQALREANSSCNVFIDGVSVLTKEDSYRVPDVVIDCGEADANSSFASEPIILAEVVSKSSVSRDVHAKLHEYFAIKSVMHYLVIYHDEGKVVHHCRDVGLNIKTQILTDGTLHLTPPGLVLKVAELFGGLS
jgi:Uma2 family endonuclease